MGMQKWPGRPWLSERDLRSRTVVTGGDLQSRSAGRLLGAEAPPPKVWSR